MAYFVAHELHIKPSEILDTWGTAELIVAFGRYANEKTNQNYEEWKHLNSEQRAKIMQPHKYAMYFEHIENG